MYTFFFRIFFYSRNVKVINVFKNKDIVAIRKYIYIISAIVTLHRFHQPPFEYETLKRKTQFEDCNL